MPAEVKIHDSALLPKVQLRMEEGGGGDGRPQIFMTDFALIGCCKLG